MGAVEEGVEKGRVEGAGAGRGGASRAVTAGRGLEAAGVEI